MDRRTLVDRVGDEVLRTRRKDDCRVARAVDGRATRTARVRDCHAIERHRRAGGDGNRIAGCASQHIAILRRVVAGQRREIDNAVLST